MMILIFIVIRKCDITITKIYLAKQYSLIGLLVRHKYTVHCLISFSFVALHPVINNVYGHKCLFQQTGINIMGTSRRSRPPKN